MRLAVFLVLTIHGIGLLALLMQGCKKEEPTVTTGGTDTNATATAFVTPTNAPPPETNVVTPQPPPPATNVESVLPPTQPAAGPTEYKIAKGDTLSSVAKKFHVSLKALMEANPGIDPTKLQIGQAIHVPAAPAPSASSSGTAPTAGATESSAGQIYTVVSGDTLTKIAAQFKTTVRALRQANNLTTDSLKVGQKLKIPTSAAPAPAVPPTSSTPPTPTPGQ